MIPTACIEFSSDCTAGNSINKQQHRITKKFFCNSNICAWNSFGFRVIKIVEDSPSCIADRLVWGAVGTLMELDIPQFFKTWAPKFQSFVRNE